MTTTRTAERHKRRRSQSSSWGIDTRGIPTHECLNCGSNIFEIGAGFENNDISFWFTSGKCAGCGAPVTVPTPADTLDDED